MRKQLSSNETRKVQTNKANYMTDDAFANLKEAMEDALAYERGERRDLKVTRVQAPPIPSESAPLADR